MGVGGDTPGPVTDDMQFESKRLNRLSSLLRDYLALLNLTSNLDYTKLLYSILSPLSSPILKDQRHQDKGNGLSSGEDQDAPDGGVLQSKNGQHLPGGEGTMEGYLPPLPQRPGDGVPLVQPGQPARRPFVFSCQGLARGGGGGGGFYQPRDTPPPSRWRTVSGGSRSLTVRKGRRGMGAAQLPTSAGHHPLDTVAIRGTASPKCHLCVLQISPTVVGTPQHEASKNCRRMAAMRH